MARCLKLGLAGIVCLALLPALAQASDSQIAELRFASFCRDWMQNVKSFALKKMHCRRVAQGFVAEYDGFSEAYSMKVKVADPVKKTFVGILCYDEVKYKRCGNTSDAAREGPFEIVSQSPVKAIFLYRNGQWLD